MLYKKPEIKSYSASDLLEEIGPCQSQYTTTTLNPPNNAADDWILYASGSYYLGSVQDPSIPIYVGDNFTSEYERGFFSFNISSLPGTIISATLRLYQTSMTQTPYTDFGNLTLDHVNFGTLEANAADFDNNDLTRNYASISDSSNGWKEFNVTTAVQADKTAGRTTSQFRVRFPVNTDNNPGDNDAIFIEDTENRGSSGNTARLVVTYL